MNKQTTRRTSPRQRGDVAIGFLFAVIVIFVIVAIVFAYLWWLDSQDPTDNNEPQVSASIIVGTDTERPGPSKVAVICPGDAVGLAWGTSNASTASIEPEFGDVALQGVDTVSPATTTVYVITAQGGGGTASDDAIVNVVTPDNNAFSKSLTEPAVDPDTGYPVDLTWRGTLSEAFISDDVIVTHLKVTLSPSNWPDWEFRKTDPTGGFHSINAVLGETSQIAEPFIAIGEWEATPVNLSADPVVTAKGPLGIELTLACK